MFRLEHPVFLLLLLPAAAAAWRIYRRGIRAGILFAPAHRHVPGRQTWRAWASRLLPILFLAGLLLAILALCRPRTVLSKVSRSTDAIAIEMVVDVSGSMEALDLSDIVANRIVKERTRLDAVKETFAKFVALRPDDLVGLVTFGGYASTRVPLTTDHQALQHTLQGVEVPKPVQDAGGAIANQEEMLTAIGDALSTACGRLQSADTKTRIAVLLSDGESNTGIIKPQEALQAAKKLGIRVYTIGVGSNATAPFRARDMFGREQLVQVEVTLDEKLLREIADTTGGRYFNVRNPKGLDEAMEAINKLEKTEIQREEYYQFRELYLWCLIPALCLIALGLTLNATLLRRVI